MKIQEFKPNTKYYFLSNFYESPFTFLGKEYRSVEHFYQAAKAQRMSDAEAIRSVKTAAKAKKMGGQICIKRNWDDIKVKVMWLALNLKFSEDEDLKQKLIETADMEIEEGNYWGDTYWGVDLKTGEGKNKLGQLLMALRRMYQYE